MVRIHLSVQTHNSQEYTFSLKRRAAGEELELLLEVVSLPRLPADEDEVRCRDRDDDSSKMCEEPDN